MNFTFTEEQEELRATVRAFLEQKSPESQVRRLMETVEGYDPAVWEQMAAQLGLQGLAIPEAFGGSGYSFRELSLVLEEMGRALLCAPFLSTVVLAAGALLASGDDDAKKEYLPGIASGATVAALAFSEDEGGWDGKGINLSATRTADGYSLSGVKSYVLDGHVAGLVLVVGATEAGLGLFAVSGDAPGLARAPLFTMDQTRKLARLEFDGVPARLIGNPGDGARILDSVLLIGAAALAVEQVGGAQRCMEMSVDYAKERIQFGRSIGSFQAVKHRCADMLVRVELAKSAAYYAAWCASEADDDLVVAAPMAKSYCSEAYFQVAADTIQVHGGIGFTWEHPAHLYFKRAKSSEILLGDPAYHRRRLAEQVGI